MNNQAKLIKYKKVQQIAKDTVRYLSSYICEGVSESDIASAVKEFMYSQGVQSFWYYDVAALVLVGKRTIESVSGKIYKTTKTKVKENDLVTVDLSPELGLFWGDFARSFIIENGKVISKPSGSSTKKTSELFEGVSIELALHDKLTKIAKPHTTFGELYVIMNDLITDFGYVNLDFKKNLGHSIEKQKEDRSYLEAGCNKRLNEVDLFTFEPHIKKKHGEFGYKWEDIYYFSKGKLKKL
ncbi:MAG: M24 family metallopeptidase [Candidatus Micrarchaeia archaeon]